MRLSEESERRLALTLIDTLREAVAQCREALVSGDRDKLKKIGHALKGNSAAFYFDFTEVKEIGEALERTPDLPKEEILRMIEQLERRIGALIQRTERG